MRIFSYLLIAIGVLMIAMNGLEQQDERAEDNKGAAAIEVETRKGDHTFWPSLAGGIILASGIVMLVKRRKRLS